MSESLARILYDSVNSRVAKFIDDSGDSLLAIAGKLRNAAGTIVNPSTEDTLASIKDTDGIKKITDPLPAGTNNIGDVDVVSSVLPTGAATEATLATRATEVTAAAIQAVLEAIRDTAGIKKITDALPAGTNRIGGVRLQDGSDNYLSSILNSAIRRLETRGSVTSPDGAHDLSLFTDGDSWTSQYGVPVLWCDAADVARRPLAEGDGALVVASKPPSAPPGTTAFVFSVAEAELEVGAGGDVSSPHTSLGTIIGNGDNLYLQLATAGTEGDSSENGSVVEVYWREGGGPTDHLVSRYYIAGETVAVLLPDVHYARDGTEMVGDGTTTRLIVVRRRLSTAALEIDFSVRGYVS